MYPPKPSICCVVFHNVDFCELWHLFFFLPCCFYYFLFPFLSFPSSIFCFNENLSWEGGSCVSCSVCCKLESGCCFSLSMKFVFLSIPLLYHGACNNEEPLISARPGRHFQHEFLKSCCSCHSKLHFSVVVMTKYALLTNTQITWFCLTSFPCLSFSSPFPISIFSSTFLFYLTSLNF